MVRLTTARAGLVLAAGLLLGCTESNTIERGTATVWNLDGTGLIVAGFDTRPPCDTEVTTAGSCVRFRSCEATTRESAGTLTFLADGIPLGSTTPDSDGRYRAIDLRDGPAPGSVLELSASGAVIPPFSLAVEMPAGVQNQRIGVGDELVVSWEPPTGATTVVVDVAVLEIDASIQCELAPSATEVTIPASLMEGLVVHSVSVTAYAESRTGSISFRAGTPRTIVLE